MEMLRSGAYHFSTFGLDAVNVGLIVAVFLLLIFYKQRQKSTKEPPTCGGILPWVGCAVSFGKSPLSFIRKKRQELGSVFSLRVAGENLTFLTDASDFHYFFESTNVDFQKAVQESVVKIANIDEASFYSYHTKLHDVMKGRLAASHMETIVEALSQQFNTNMNTFFQTDVKQNLMESIRRSMYMSVMNNLFGKEQLPVKTKEEFEVFLDHFKTFDEQFEMGAKLPSFMIPKWVAAKTYLLKTFSGMVKNLKEPSSSPSAYKTMFESMLEAVDSDITANYGMVVMWASLANAIPLTFWSLSYILSNKDILDRLKSELQEVFHGRDKDEQIKVTEEDIKKIPFLKWCVLETIRIRSVGVITRKVVKSFQIRDYEIKEGSMLMLSPYWTHRDEKYYPEPEVYRPTRWETINERKWGFQDGYIAFGGGRYQCPGRWFALVEIQLYIALFLLKYDCQVHSDVPDICDQHLVGTQKPATEFLVTCQKKSRDAAC